jgi:hypothetical protein
MWSDWDAGVRIDLNIPPNDGAIFILRHFN